MRQHGTLAVVFLVRKNNMDCNYIVSFAAAAAANTPSKIVFWQSNQPILGQ